MTRSKPLDLAFRVDDEVYLTTSSGIYSQRAIVLHHDGEGNHIVRYKHGPGWADWTQTEAKAEELRFACHHHGAPFENIVLDEAGQFANGQCSGLAHGLAGEFYPAGGPWTSEFAKKGSHSCRHLVQHDDFSKRNNTAWLKGWAKGQERAKMAIKLDFTKPLRTVRDHKAVYYVGAISGSHVVAVGGELPPVVINEFGLVQDPDDPFGMIVENVPEPVTTVIRFRPDGVCLGDHYKGPTTPQDILVTVRIEEGKVTLLESN